MVAQTFDLHMSSNAFENDFQQPRMKYTKSQTFSLASRLDAYKSNWFVRWHAQPNSRNMFHQTALMRFGLCFGFVCLLCPYRGQLYPLTAQQLEPQVLVQCQQCEISNGALLQKDVELPCLNINRFWFQIAPFFGQLLGHLASDIS